MRQVVCGLCGGLFPQPPGFTDAGGSGKYRCRTCAEIERLNPEATHITKRALLRGN